MRKRDNANRNLGSSRGNGRGIDAFTESGCNPSDAIRHGQANRLCQLANSFDYEGIMGVLGPNGDDFNR